ncbi:MAG: glycoside hydrolase [Cytophagales bacterium]|nr:glycoside hydrolase [Cytophagales bacterium]
MPLVEIERMERMSWAKSIAGVSVVKIGSIDYLLRLLPLLILPVVSCQAQRSTFSHEMRVFPDSLKFDVTRHLLSHDAPSEQGWYYSVAGVASTPEGLVAVYRKSDFHTAVTTDIMVTYSTDKGRTWTGHHSIAHADVWNERAVWIAPQLSRLSDGRLVIICDLGHRTAKDDWPMLSHWQKPNRGMANYVFWSADHGKTWDGPHLTDQVGGEPGYITELADGALLYTRTQSATTDQLWNPPLPWGHIFYFNESVTSRDGGKTWNQVSLLSKDPHHGDCEVGTVEIEPGKILGVTRIGFGNGRYGQPSRWVYSYDGAKSWGDPKPGPVYAQRPIVRRLQSGKLLLVYRNVWGTPGTCAMVFDPDEKLSYQPSSYIFEEERCVLKDGVMHLETRDDLRGQVAYRFYPAQAPDSRVKIEADIKLDEAGIHGCNISVGCWVRLEPGRISLADRPDEGFELDATQWHHYEIVRDNGIVSITVDGERKLHTAVKGLETRLVQIGNRQTGAFGFHKIGNDQVENWHTHAKSQWKSLSVTVENKNDYNINWQWDPGKGYPDQFRRDRIILLDKIASSPGHCGYSGATQMEDGTIVITDYTVGGNGGKPAKMPFIRAYVTTEADLTNTNKK